MKRWLALFGLALGVCAGSAMAQTLTKPGSAFRDCPTCPQMMVVPAGSFSMGDSGHSRERPVHTVTIAKPFAIGVYPVTFQEWDACAADGGCNAYRPDDHGWGRGRHPVINVSWDDARGYALWLSHKTGKTYRLPSEAEWEYAARGGTQTLFWFGDWRPSGQVNCKNCIMPYAPVQTALVDAFKPNPYGLYDMAGNVTQWVADRWHDNYDGAPTDGRVWEPGDARRATMRNGSWFNEAAVSQAAFRNGDRPDLRNIKVGFRVVEAP